MRTAIIAELATNHGGDVTFAAEMIRTAAAAGADWVKTQAYQIKHLNPADPQYAWLRQSELSVGAHQQLRDVAQKAGVHYLTTAFHPSDVARLEGVLGDFKIGHAESGAGWWRETSIESTVRFVSYAWAPERYLQERPLVTIPLYPAPLEAFAALDLPDWCGYSDHSVGVDLCKIAIARGVPVVEKHFCLPGKGRNQPWDMDPDDLAELRAWAERCATALAGTGAQARWQYRG